MNSLTWIHRLCNGFRKSQIKTLNAILTAFIQCKSAILNEIAREMTYRTGVAVDHTLKRINRFLGNKRIDRKVVYANITRFVLRRIRHWKTIPIAFDWSFCEKREKWQVLAASVVVRGRGIPILIWAFEKGEFGALLSQNRVEEAFLTELETLVAPFLRKKQTVVILADRGFARTGLFRHIQDLGWHYVIRVKYNVHINTGHEQLLIGDIALKKGEVKEFRSIKYRKNSAITVRRLVATRPVIEKNLDPWFLASSLQRGAEAVIKLYTLRFTIEEDFRTMKSNLSWKDCRIKRLEHYRQFLLLIVLALFFAFFVGMAACNKPSLAKHLVRRRKGAFDTSITVLGIRLIRFNWGSLAYIQRIDKLAYPL